MWLASGILSSNGCLLIQCRKLRRSDRRNCKPFRFPSNLLVIRIATAIHKIDHIVGIVTIATVDNAVDYRTHTILAATNVEIVVLEGLISSHRQVD